MHAAQVVFLTVDVRLQVQQASSVGGGYHLGAGVDGELHLALSQLGGDWFEIGGEAQRTETAAGAFEFRCGIHKVKPLRVAQKCAGLVVQRVVVQSLAVVDKKHAMWETVVHAGCAANIHKKIGDVVDAFAEFLIFDVESRVEIHFWEYPSHICHPSARGTDDVLFARKLSHGLVQLFAARCLLQRVVGFDTHLVEDFNQIESGLGRKLVVGGRNHYVHFGVVHCANALSYTKLF